MSGEPWLGENRFCGRGPEECDGIAEPEEDGEVRYHKCVKCGFEFGYQVAGQPAQGDCQLGVPESVRLQFSAAQPPGVMSLESGGERRSVFIGATIKRRAE